MSIAAGADVNTYVSNPSGPVAQSAAPGAAGAGAQMGVDKAALVLLVTAVGGLVGLRLLFGGKGLPPMRVDASEAIKVFLAYQTINIPLKLLAYHFHGHQASQAYILLA